MKKRLTVLAKAGSVLLAVCLAIGVIFPAAGTQNSVYAEEAAEQSELEQELATWGEPISGTFGDGYMIDFENEELDTVINEIGSLSELWVAENATGEHISKIEERLGSKVLHFAPFSRMYTSEGLTNKYVFSSDINMPQNQGFGVFFRSTGEESINPYYEDDLSGLGILGIGPSGIYVTPNGKQIRLMIKYYDQKRNSDRGGRYINNKQIMLNVDCDFDKEFCNISILDYGTGAKIYVAGKLVATLEFADVVEGYDEILSFCKFYSKVTVYDAAGNEKAVVENALTCAEDSTLAFGMRINEAYVDNVSITEYAYAVSEAKLNSNPKTSYYVGDSFDGTGSELAITQENGIVRKVQLSENMLEGFDTATVGDKEVTVLVDGYEGDPIKFTINVAEKPAATEVPAATEAPTEAPAQTDDDETSGGVKPLTIGLIAGGVLIVLIVIAAIILTQLKKKKKD